MAVLCHRDVLFALDVQPSPVATWKVSNPMLAGADPHGMVIDGKVWMYVTWSPGPEPEFYAFSSTNWMHWEKHGPILNLKDVPWVWQDGEKAHYAWAPCLFQRGARYYFYYAVGPQGKTGSRIGVAVGDSPAGPFVDSGQALIHGGQGWEAIDPMVFQDPKSGQVLLYTGGSAGAKLKVFRLSQDLVHTQAEIPVETPPQFTEAPFMHFANGQYYLSYSHGSYQRSSYSVHYATSTSATGPWTYRGAILTSDVSHKGPGHHAFLDWPQTGAGMLVYHRWEHQSGDGPYQGLRQICADRFEYNSDGTIRPIQMTDEFEPWPVPGVVIDHSPASSGRYIGSPSLVRLPGGTLLASHDFFGPKSGSDTCATTVLFASEDQGLHWTRRAEVKCFFWANLFVHRGNVYLMGTTRENGLVTIARSTDEGRTWTSADSASTGLLTSGGEWHTAAVPVVEHAGRLWRAFEEGIPGARWGARFQAGMLSIPVDADLLQASNWVFSSRVSRDPTWLNGQFGGWLEGNAVIARNGKVVNLLRVDTPGLPEKAAWVSVTPDGREASFRPSSGFFDMPGGAKKFTIRSDPKGRGYWTIATPVPEGITNSKPAGIRNRLVLMHSKDLKRWTVTRELLFHPDPKVHGFQYVDWIFDQEDIIAVCRTAFDDPWGGAHNFHDANFMTFHRIPDFRKSAPANAR